MKVTSLHCSKHIRKKPRESQPQQGERPELAPWCRQETCSSGQRGRQASPRKGWPCCSCDCCTHILGWATGRGTVCPKRTHNHHHIQLCVRVKGEVLSCVHRRKLGLGESFLPTFAEGTGSGRLDTGGRSASPERRRSLSPGAGGGGGGGVLGSCKVARMTTGLVSCFSMFEGPSLGQAPALAMDRSPGPSPHSPEQRLRSGTKVLEVPL